MQRVFINGFGRIGRTVLRAWAEGGWPGVEVVGLNDIADPALCAHLFEYDSTFGPYRGRVALEAGPMLRLDGRAIPLHGAQDISSLDLSGVDLVMECTGAASRRDQVDRGLRGGAGRVLVSGPSSVADITVVMGANDGDLGAQRIVSNASCTTNALAPLVRRLDEAFGIERGWMTTIHCYTGSQPTIDAPRGDFARSRSAALSMVPTTTSAAHLLEEVLPGLAGRVEAAAVRVPVASVSAVDLTACVARLPGTADLRALFPGDPIIGATDRALVSTDLRARPESLVVSLPETRVTAAGMLRVFGWYDNEWGFACRMLDMAAQMTRA